MVKTDLIAQWLAGDELKQDQFKFIYKVMKVIYDSALRNPLINEKAKVIKTVLPNLTAFYSVLLISDINETKLAEKKKEQEKAEREGKTVTFEEEIDE